MAEAANQKLTQEYSAEDLDDLLPYQTDVELVRDRPIMFLGATGPDRLRYLLIHLMAHSERGGREGFVTTIGIALHPHGGITIEHDHHSLEVDFDETLQATTLEVAMTRFHLDTQFSLCKAMQGISHAYVMVANALSSHCTAEVIQQDGVAFRQSYRQGVPVTDVESHETSETHGLRITIQPDPYIFPDTNFNPTYIRQHLQQVARDNPGLQLNFTDERTGEQQSFQYNA